MYTGSRRRHAYRDWKREVQAYRLAYQVAPEAIGPRVWLRLGGEAKDVTEHLDLETELAVEGGLDKLLTALDKAFLQEDCDRVDEAVSEFWQLRREAGQSMEGYIAAFAQAKLKMKREDPRPQSATRRML